MISDRFLFIGAAFLFAPRICNNLISMVSDTFLEQIRARSTRKKETEKEMEPQWTHYAIENVTIFVKVNPGDGRAVWENK